MRTLIFLLTFFSFYSFSQEKRLALVIGNANYDKGRLDNPVNDALLMSKTLKELGFDVILDTNISTLEKFNKVILEFGERRDQYNVGFIYYAGHGVQINDVNYLLATKEEYTKEFHVELKALSVQQLMRFLTSRTDEVNVLILDACRDNPFEQNWNPKSRSTEGGRGLAKIAPPTGSLIAYSTDAGNTAADGVEKNSIYCLSLARNMMIENISLDQVFRNVRSEVLELSKGKQRPVEASQLTGESFYLKRGSFEKQIEEIDSLIELNKFDLAREKTSSILTLDSNNKKALLRKGRIDFINSGDKYEGVEIKKAISLYPNDPEVYEYMSMYYSEIGNYKNALEEINKSIKLNPENPQYYHLRASYQTESKNLLDALLDYSMAIQLDSKNPERYYNRAVFFQYNMENFDGALLDYSKAIELDMGNVESWYSRGYLYFNSLKNDKKALDDFYKVLEIDQGNLNAINSIGVIYENQNNLDLAIEQYEKCISLEEYFPESASYCFGNRAEIYTKQGKLDEALKDYTKAIELDSKNPERYNNRGVFYQDYVNDLNGALLDFSKAIELEKNNTDYLYNRGILYYDYFKNYKKAIEDFEYILQIDPKKINAINMVGLIHKEQNKFDLAISYYEKGIALESEYPEAAAFCYNNRAEIFSIQGKLELALFDLSQAIELDKQNAIRYETRGLFYQDFKKDYNSALIDFSKAIEFEQDNIEYRYNRGYLYHIYLKDDKKAIEDFEYVLRKEPDNIDAINWIGVIYNLQNKIDQAIAHYEKGIALENTSPLSASYCYGNRAQIYAEQGKLDQALKDYSKAIDLDPKNPERYMNRGLFYENYKLDYNNALIDYSHAIELDKTVSEYNYYRGVLYSLYLNDNNKALTDLEQAVIYDSTNIDAILFLGAIYHDQGRLNDALVLYEKAIKMSVNNNENLVRSISSRAELYAQKGNFDLAMIDYNECVKIDPLNPTNYFNRGEFYELYLNDYSLALKDYTKAIELDPKDASFYYHRSRIFSSLSNAKSQLKDLDQSIKLDPENFDYPCERALFLGLNGDFESALKEIDILILKDTSQTNSLLYKAKLLLNNGDNEFANRVLDEVIAKAPNDPESYFIKARLAESQGKNINAASNYSKAKTKLEVGNYYMTDDRGNILEKSEIHIHIARFYEKIGEKEMMCEEYKLADELLKNETRYHFQKLIIEVNDKLKFCINN